MRANLEDINGEEQISGPLMHLKLRLPLAVLQSQHALEEIRENILQTDMHVAGTALPYAFRYLIGITRMDEQAQTHASV